MFSYIITSKIGRIGFLVRAILHEAKYSLKIYTGCNGVARMYFHIITSPENRAIELFAQLLKHELQK